MNSRNIVRLYAMVFLVIAVLPAANAQLTRSWVSSAGVDSNDCTRPTPCRTFGRAISQSNSGAEVVVMDSAGYGPFTINKAISIISPPAFHAAIAPNSGTAITISTGISGAVVIRGLYLNAQGGATNGILDQGNNPLIIENCVISGFTSGINFDTAVTPYFVVTDSTIRNSSTDGIVWKGASPGRGVLEHTRLENNANRAFFINGGGAFSIRDSIITMGTQGVFVDADGASVDLIDSAAVNNDGIAIYASASGATGVNVNLDHCLLSKNGGGILAQSPGGASTIRVSHSLIADNNNGVGWGGGTAQVLSRGDNTLEANNSGNTFTTTYAAK